MKTIIQIQQEYMETVSAAKDRWSHRRNGGHAGRTQSAAHAKAKKALLKIGFTEKQAWYAIKDAHDMMSLERAGVDDELNHAV